MRSKICLLLAAVGFWLVMEPATFGYEKPAIAINNWICGPLLLILGFIAIPTQKKWPIKLCILIGLWLQLAPLFFWAGLPVSYLNNTLAGMIVMLLGFSVPGLADTSPQGEAPAGWSLNPSGWGLRGVTVFLALLAWFLARYLSAFQLGYIDSVEEPIFGNGTTKVLSSSVAKFFPVSDAGLGAFGYSIEFLLGFIGSDRRWKTMPWVSIFFAIMVIPAGFISITLIVLQPIVVGAWCGCCLLITICMLIMLVLTIPEMVATMQVLAKAKKNKTFWQTFWHGDNSSPAKVVKPINRNFVSQLGLTLQWNLLLSALLGAWLMVSPWLLRDAFPADDSNYITGPLLITFSVIALSEVARSLRWVNMAIAASLILTAFLLDGFSFYGLINNCMVGIALALLTIPKGKQRERYGA